MTKITGNTYPVKDQIRALGGRWNAASKCWEVPDDKATEAQSLVGKAPKKAGGYNPCSRKGTCKTCGQRINYGVYCGKCEYR
jgi:hypothetical protein